MAVLDDYYKQKAKQKPKKGILDDFYKERERRARIASVPAQKEELRKQGFAISTRKDRATPSFTGSILRDILRIPATLLARPGQALAAIKGFTPEEQTVKSSYLGDITTSKNSKDVIKDVGRGFELASYGLGIGAGKSAIASAGKQSAKEIGKRLAVEGAVSGFAGSAGRAITDDKKGLDAIKDIGIGTFGGGVGGGILGYLGGRIAGKTLSAQERAMERAFGEGKTYKIPEAGKPPAIQLPERASPAKTPAIELPEPGILKAGEDLRKPPVKKPEVQIKTPLEVKAGSFNSKKDFINSQLKLINTINETNKAVKKFGGKNVIEQVKLTEKQLGDIWEKAHATPKEVRLPKQTKEQIIPKQTTQQVVQSQQIVEQQPVSEILIDKNKIKEDTDWLAKIENKANENDVRGFEQSSKRYQERLIQDEESLINYAMGLGDEDPKLPRTSARKLLSRDADLSNNVALSEKLSLSNVRRASGQELVGNRIFEEETTADLLEMTRRKRATKLGITENQLTLEEAKLFKELNEEIGKKVSYTEEDLLDMIKDYLC